jgi:threonine dehydratase
MLPSLADIESAAQTIYTAMAPTPQYAWPLLCEQLGTQIWVKHENHTPVGAFKIRGGLIYFQQLTASRIRPAGVICATRGNHGQSVGFAAARMGLPATIVVPHGNSVEKNAAMRALGVELIEHGEDFQEALEAAIELAHQKNLQMVPSYHPLLVTGVASYGLELLRAVPDLDTVYVPIGLGSGICGMLAARNALGLKTEVVGVVSAHAPAYADSFAAGRLLSHPTSTEIADGMACRTPNPGALEIIRNGVDRIVQVTDDEVKKAMRLLFECTHNVAEGAGAAATAAAFQERARLAGRKVAVVMSGGNVDRKLFSRVMQ